MPKTEVEAQFDYLVAKIIWPHFKPLGYRKTGNNFRLLLPDELGKILQFQRSTGNDASHLRFTINVGIYVPHAWAGDSHALSPQFREPECLIRERIGLLRPASKDHWYELGPAFEAEQVYRTVEHDIRHYAVPFLDSFPSRKATLEAVIRQSDLTDIDSRIRVMHANGHPNEARQLVAQTIAQTSRQQLKDFLLRLSTELGL